MMFSSDKKHLSTKFLLMNYALEFGQAVGEIDKNLLLCWFQFYLQNYRQFSSHILQVRVFMTIGDEAYFKYFLMFQV